MIFGSSVFNYMAHFLRRHPDIDKPLIDYEATMLLEPIALLGTTVGVLFNVMFPNWLTTILVVTVLILTTWRTTDRGIMLYKREYLNRFKDIKSGSGGGSNTDEKDVYSKIGSEEEDFEKIVKEEEFKENVENVKKGIKEEKEKKEGLNLEKEDYLPKPTLPENKQNEIELMEKEKEKPEEVVDTQFINLPEPSHPVTKEEVDEEENRLQRDLKTVDPVPTELKIILAEERSTFPIIKVGVLMFSWFIVFFFSLLKGGAHGAPSFIGVQSCSFFYWFFFFGDFPIIIILTLLCSLLLLGKNNRKVKYGYVFKEGEIQWNLVNVLLYPVISSVAGVLASLLGIGGGTIKGPLLLELGLHPEVSSATSSFMILFTSSISVFQYLVINRLKLDYALVYFINGFFSAVIGEIFISYPASKYKMTFLIVSSIAIVIGLSTFLMGGVGLYQFIVDVTEEANIWFKSPC